MTSSDRGGPASADLGKAARVLVVDDEEAISRLVARVLEPAGHVCMVAANVAEAREALAANDFDLVVADVQMPGESGIVLARHVAAHHPHTAIVMMSGLDDPAIAESALEVGAYGYMIKPVARNEILIGVANALRRRALELENQAFLVTLQERQALLERLARIQRSISRRAALEDVLHAIVAGAQELLGEEIAVLRIVDQDDPATMVIRASAGMAADEVEVARRAPVGEGADGRAIAAGDLAAIDGTEPAAKRSQAVAGLRAAAAIAAPVRESGQIAGSLVVASYDSERIFSGAEQEMLIAFAEHASLALTDARMVEQVRDATHDPLTGLPNRGLFLEKTSATTARTRAGDVDPAVLLIELDRLGVVNETLGHEVGDALLCAVAALLRECVRASDTVARVGGGDFAILLNDVSARSNPEEVAERIFAAFESPIDLDGRQIAVTASIGIASGRGDAHEMLRHADVAMYRARREGKSRYERFTPGMKAGMLQRLELEADLLRAVERDEFVVHYQPIVALAGQQLVGFEALVRWQHPRRELIPPLSFIPLAEELGLINAIGRRVLNEACRQAARWQAERPTDPALYVTVNLSARQLQRPDLVQEVRTALRESELEPHRLVLEITETILMNDADMAASALIELKRLGVRLAIDDFGTGYSSLHYIRRFPLDILKIAKPFIDGIARSREDLALVKTILDLANNFNLQVVAEGVETLRQSVELGRLGCPLVQGYLFSRPVDGETAVRMLSQPGRGYGRLGRSASQDFALPPALVGDEAATLR